VADTVSTASRPRKALGDGAAAFIERVAAQAGQFVVFIAAARILSPAEFGVFALASASAILLLRASEMGWQPYIMSWAGDDRRPRQVVFLALICGGSVAALGQVLGQVLIAVRSSPELGQLTLLFSLWVGIATVSTAQKGVMVWQGRLKGAAFCEIIAEASGLVIALASLYVGHGIFALVYGRLGVQSVLLAGSFLVTRKLPIFSVPSEAMREIWVFSAQLFASRMIIHFRAYTATFIIGAFLGPAAVGFYRAADRVVSALGEALGVPAQLLAWNLFRQARDAGPEETGTERLRAVARLYFKVLIACSVPPFAWLILMSDEIVLGLLSEEWLPAVPLVALLAVARILYMPGVATEPLMSISGQAKHLPVFTVTIFTFSLVLTLIAAQFGLYSLVWSQVIVAAGTLILTLRLYRKYVGIPWQDVWGGLGELAVPLVIGIAALWAFDFSGIGEGWPSLVEAVVGALVALVVYLVALGVFAPGFLSAMRSGTGVSPLNLEQA